MCFKTSLEFLPEEKSEWLSVTSRRRHNYQQWAKDLACPQANSEHLVPAILRLIRKDVMRNLADTGFFNPDPTKGPTLHFEAAVRILYVYASLNPGVSYVQG